MKLTMFTEKGIVGENSQATEKKNLNTFLLIYIEIIITFYANFRIQFIIYSTILCIMEIYTKI